MGGCRCGSARVVAEPFPYIALEAVEMRRWAALRANVPAGDVPMVPSNGLVTLCSRCNLSGRLSGA
jgi:hypothetical protein